MTTISCKDSAEVSCIIGNILAELEQPCQSCQPDGAVVLTGRYMCAKWYSKDQQRATQEHLDARRR